MAKPEIMETSVGLGRPSFFSLYSSKINEGRCRCTSKQYPSNKPTGNSHYFKGSRHHPTPPPPDFEPVYIDEFNGTPTLAAVAAVSSSAAVAACGGL